MIENFKMFGVAKAQIVLHYLKDEEIYRSSIMYWLDEGNEEVDKNVTLYCDLYHEDPKQLAKITFLYNSTLFANSVSVVLILDEHGEIEEELDLSIEHMAPDGASVH